MIYPAAGSLAGSLGFGLGTPALLDSRGSSQGDLASPPRPRATVRTAYSPLHSMSIIHTSPRPHPVSPRPCPFLPGTPRNDDDDDDDASPNHPERLPPTARHLAIPPSLPRRIVRLQHPRLTLVRLTEGITPLLPHALHLPHLPDRFLELFHPALRVSQTVTCPLRKDPAVMAMTYLGR